LGIAMVDLDEAKAQAIGLPTTAKGTLVGKVYPKTPAQIAGFLPSDLIQKIDGKDINSGKDVQDYVHAHKVLDTLHFLILRNNAAKTLSVVIGQYPDKIMGGRNTDGEDD